MIIPLIITFRLEYKFVISLQNFINPIREMYDQTSIIRDLLRWLDEHLDQPLSLDNVAAKAGYPRHLQRMFKDVTAEAIGATSPRPPFVTRQP